MSALASRLRAAWLVGPRNVARVAAYRLGLCAGLHPVQRIGAKAPASGPFFAASLLPPLDVPGVQHWVDGAFMFGRHKIPIKPGPPEWHRDPVGGRALNAGDDWWCIPDFSDIDIKAVWELSRFDWALAFAQRARNGDVTSLDRLNAWLDDWSRSNPPYKGANWKCGQETSLRVLHLAAAALILGQERSTQPGLLNFIEAHLARIAPTVSYATAQANNHATSEAAALFVGGSWLVANGRSTGSAHMQAGRRQLERHVARLFEADGTFSQYSVNYHRLALDTVSFAEVWRIRQQSPPFSSRFAERAAAATRWLYAFVDPTSGDAPVLGANDGARLFQLTPTGYRDYRPSVQLAAALFLDARAYPPGPHDACLSWLGVKLPPSALVAPTSHLFAQGGYAVLRRRTAMAVLRFPMYRFRPGQADALHVDLWLGSRNLLRDAGSFSYNDTAGRTAYFMSTAAHNTVQFDGTEQMRPVGRFLHADWLTTSDMTPMIDGDASATFGAAYRDRAGRRHSRHLELTDETLTVTDDIGNFAERAVLRWRLCPGEWCLNGLVATCGDLTVTIESNQPVARAEIVAGVESRYYHEITEVPVLQVETTRPGRLVTTVCWAA